MGSKIIIRNCPIVFCFLLIFVYSCTKKDPIKPPGNNDVIIYESVNLAKLALKSSKCAFGIYNKLNISNDTSDLDVYLDTLLINNLNLESFISGTDTVFDTTDYGIVYPYSFNAGIYDTLVVKIFFSDSSKQEIKPGYPAMMQNFDSLYLIKAIYIGSINYPYRFSDFNISRVSYRYYPLSNMCDSIDMSLESKKTGSLLKHYERPEKGEIKKAYYYNQSYIDSIVGGDPVRGFDDILKVYATTKNFSFDTGSLVIDTIKNTSYYSELDDKKIIKKYGNQYFVTNSSDTLIKGMVDQENTFYDTLLQKNILILKEYDSKELPVTIDIKDNELNTLLTMYNSISDSLFFELNKSSNKTDTLKIYLTDSEAIFVDSIDSDKIKITYRSVHGMIYGVLEYEDSNSDKLLTGLINIDMYTGIGSGYVYYDEDKSYYNLDFDLFGSSYIEDVSLDE